MLARDEGLLALELLTVEEDPSEALLQRSFAAVWAEFLHDAAHLCEAIMGVCYDEIGAGEDGGTRGQHGEALVAQSYEVLEVAVQGTDEFETAADLVWAMVEVDGEVDDEVEGLQAREGDGERIGAAHGCHCGGVRCSGSSGGVGEFLGTEKQEDGRLFPCPSCSWFNVTDGGA
jgi:hypothetical protein